ncbi:hypothetical protein ACFTSF_32465 [Kribbella sp. NPDC056951]|uniref:hypothetical protein n=1 Tax=Kribbella sp. NPDC056951 TaxID=3345978 RepID=UPI00362B3BBD
MTVNRRRIVELALAARTEAEALEVQRMIEAAIGARNQRPLGNTWNNQGILTGSGASYDHKALEVVTNMQDAVLERFAVQKYKSRAAAPFATPHEAAQSLFSGMTKKEQAELSSVSIDRAAERTGKKRVTIVMRDQGCGITPAEVPQGIFRVGSKHKDGCDWQQGTFGLGGATTYRNARVVVLVTRRHPDLLKSNEADLISVAIVEWNRVRTTVNASYLVTKPWDEDDPATWSSSVPFSVRASEYPSFEPGTHLALISFDTEGFGRRSGDEKSFDTILNTRLYRPVLPTRYRNNITRANRDEVLGGLERRLNDNPGEPGSEGVDTLPFNHEGLTYQLPIRFRIFAKRNDKGERRNFVAHGHSLLVTSNGQAHFHWTPLGFKQNTRLNKLYDRILVIVESDALPIEVRTELFTADRAQLVSSPVALRLEKEIAAFLDEWPALNDANRALIREAITGDNNSRPTIAIAEKIARAFKAKGFTIGSTGVGGSGGRGRKTPEPTPPEDLYDDPTHFEGPTTLEAQPGKVKGLYFKLNAKDGFLGRDRRGQLVVTCDHPDIGADEITVGELRSGRVRVSIAVPDGADLGPYMINAEIAPWSKSAGGLGPRFDWTTKLDIQEVIKPKDSGATSGQGSGKHGSGDGGLVAMIWKSDAEMEDWTPATVGQIEMVPAKDLAEQREEYKELASVDGDIPTVVLNRTYSHLKTYTAARAAELTDEGKEATRDRYAVGVGVALLVIDEDARKSQKAGRPMDEAAVGAGQRAAARAVLSVMPEYDRLARELED